MLGHLQFARGAAAALLAILFSGPAFADFIQDGAKLVGTLNTGAAQQGYAVALSADGNTMVSGGPADNVNFGATWVFVRNSGAWVQQTKLVGTGASGANPAQGVAVALSADGNTAAVGAFSDVSNNGAVWIFVRSNNVWTQQGNKLTPSDEIGQGRFGYAISLSADGNTVLISGPADNASVGAAWVFTRSGGVWTQQGSKLVGTGNTGAGQQGVAVALSGDGNTAAIGANLDNAGAGAFWVYTRSGGVWTQQGSKLVGSGAVAGAPIQQGRSIALSSDGNTLIEGGLGDNSGIGAAWVFTRSGGVWTQQGNKLVGTGVVGGSFQGSAVALSSDGNVAAVGGFNDGTAGATWTYTRSGTTWTQFGTKRVGSGAAGASLQGSAVALSADGITLAVGGRGDNANQGATWVFVQPLAIGGNASIAAAGNVGGPFLAPSFDYTFRAVSGSVNFTISAAPDWLTPSLVSRTIPAGATIPITFTVNALAHAKPVGTYGPTNITITDNTNGGTKTIAATLTVSAAGAVTAVSAVLPASRSVQLGNIATAFATIINTSSTAGTNCGLSFGSNAPAVFHFQTTNPATNALTGTLNTGVSIPAGGSQTYVFSLEPTAVFAPSDLPIIAGCTNGTPAPSVVGLNTLLLSASAVPVPDMVALAATAGNDGIVNVQGATGAGAFAVASVNVGASANITVSTDTGAATLPVTIALCQTNPATGVCTSTTGPTVTTNVFANDTPTFAIFVQGTGNVPFDPAASRIFVRFKDNGGVVRGATSVAVRTQ